MSDDFRRKWDKDAYAVKADLRASGKLNRNVASSTLTRHEMELEKLQSSAEPYTPKLISQRGDLNLEERINVSYQVSGDQQLTQHQPGFHCGLCNLNFRDNLSYLDHLNSTAHLRASGFSSRIKRSTVIDVQERLRYLAEEKRKPKVVVKVDLKSRVESAIAQDLVDKKAAKDIKKRTKLAAQAAPVNDVDPEMAQMMGFGGFGSSKSS